MLFRSWKMQFRSAVSVVAAFVTQTLLLESLRSEDKSGVSPTVISLPAGPGSIEGLGESCQMSLTAGTGKYSLPLGAPPGPAGHAPNIGLVYDGGGGNGILGPGWSLPLRFIQRQTEKGLPRYVDANNGLDDDGDGVT